MFYAPFGLNSGPVDVSFCIASMVLVLWELVATLGTRYGIQGQNYVALL